MNRSVDYSEACVFPTAFGWAAIGWSARGVSRLWLPQDDRALLDRAVAGFTAGGREHATLIERVRSYFAGETVDFGDVALDLSGIDPFRLAVYRETSALAYGETLTYGQLAERAGHAGLARETGQALGANPIPLIIPCHRILAAGNKIGGFSGPGGSATKERMLALEGVRPVKKAEQIALPL